MSSSFFEKLNQVQVRAKCPKNQFNSYGGYSYRSCEDILEGIKPLLKELNLSVKLTDEMVQVGDRFYLKAVAVLTDGEQEQISTGFAREPETKKGMDPSQITGAASSYARKYALQGLLALDDNKDADYLNNGDGGQQKGQKQAQAPAQKQQAQGQQQAPAAQKAQAQGGGGLEGLPQVEGVTFKEVTGKDGNQYVIAEGDTYNKKTQLEKLGFKKRKSQDGSWVVYREKQAQAA